MMMKVETQKNDSLTMILDHNTHVLEEEDSHLSLMQEPNMASPGKSEPGQHQAIPWPRFPWHKE